MRYTKAHPISVKTNTADAETGEVGTPKDGSSMLNTIIPSQTPASGCKKRNPRVEMTPMRCVSKSGYQPGAGEPVKELCVVIEDTMIVGSKAAFGRRLETIGG